MAGGAVDIIKRNKKRGIEPFSDAKLRASIIAACLSAKAPAGQAEVIANSVLKEIDVWLKQREEITSNDLRLVTSRYLKIHHPDAAYLYEVHKVIL